jgi:hypothetical protein
MIGMKKIQSVGSGPSNRATMTVSGRRTALKCILQPRIQFAIIRTTS